MRHGGRAKFLALIGALVGIGINTLGAPLLPSLTSAASPDGLRLAPRMAISWSIEELQGARYVPKMMGDGYVGPNGALEVGPYGSVAIAGLTLSQAEAAITKQVTPHIKHPRVRLRLVEANSAPAAAAMPMTAPSEAGPSLGMGEQPRAAEPAPNGIAQPLPTSPLGPPPVVANLGAPTPAPGPVINAEWHPVARGPDAPAPRLIASNWTPIQRPESVVPAGWHAPMPAGPPLAPSEGSVAPAGPTVVGVQVQPKTDKPEDLPIQPRVLPGPPAGSPPLIDGPPPGMVGVPGPPPHPPTECRKQSLPPYVIEPPDILIVESTQSIRDQPVRGQHLVRPDGTIQLGIYGYVYVAGMTLDQAREAIAMQLSIRVRDLDRRNLYVDVLAYNSKFYYVITDGGGYGEQVIRFPITGSETVLDALSQINGIPPVGSKKHIWVARSFPCDGHEKVLPVDWCAISQRGNTTTNYQLMPGDRVYVQAQKIIWIDSTISKVVSPIERLFGVTLLGSATVNSFKSNSGGSGR